MKKMKKAIFQGSYKFIFGIVLGMILTSGGVYALTTIMGSNVIYSNADSELSSTNVQGAIDELYQKVNSKGNFMEAYSYSETGSNQCITGEEETCKRTTCYKDKIANSCPAGTIIMYKVKDLMAFAFHVIADNGDTLIMQAQEDTTETMPWCKNYYDSEPNIVLPKLEEKTANWTNLNNQTYIVGTGTTEKTSKVRMITTQEAKILGCIEEKSNSCPKWMADANASFWTLDKKLIRDSSGGITTNIHGFDDAYGTARAVIEVSK